MGVINQYIGLQAVKNSQQTIIPPPSPRGRKRVDMWDNALRVAHAFLYRWAGNNQSHLNSGYCCLLS